MLSLHDLVCLDCSLSPQIAECFADCLGGLLSVVGQNMTMTIEAQPHCMLGTVHYKNKPQMDPDNKR